MTNEIPQYRLELRAPEIIVLKRALAIYARFYLDLVVKSGPQWEKDDCKQKAGAADRLAERLKTDIRPADTVSQTVLNRITEELRTTDQSTFTNDATGWERATEIIIKSLTK